MLSALELAGFKSFAEKTRFDFPDGITVIVGPNGSGKSNVVDAIKWVLGAQSAKALRGKDMSDVIFKGSTSAGRKPSNSAEATLVFDNSEKRLPIDAEEVNVTRRVYRSGDSEYLINGQSCRLKDIKDLFRGTGVGVDAYSLIEQGKVDRMLQASPKDRRIIFEEAAGISRFNAKKVEANRRLGRVEQNLVRLKDIVDEVHTRLTGLQRQAKKAQSYREMNTRLREVRLRLGHTEYSQLSKKIESLESSLQELEELESTQAQELADAREQSQHSEQKLHRVAEECQTVEADLQATSQTIAVSRNQQAALNSRSHEHTQEARRHTVRLAALRQRASSSQSEVDALESQVAQARSEFDRAKQLADTASARLVESKQELAQRTERCEYLRRKHVELLHETTAQSSGLARAENLLEELDQGLLATEEKIIASERDASAARKTAELASTRLKDFHRQNSEASTALARAKTELDTNRSLLANQQEEAAVIKGRLTGISERLNLLEQLEQHLEGVDAGARHVLELAEKTDAPEFRSIRGLAAELFDVQVELAPLVDIALGNAANALVIEDDQLIRLIQADELEIPGRLSLMRMDRLPARRIGEKIQLDGVRGVIGRADRVVTCQPDYEQLINYLLGTTWLVESLDIALELSHFRGAGLRFVTAGCQLIEADGMLTIGAMQSSSGLVSRRSEIHNAREEISDLRNRYQKSQGEIERLSGRIDKLLPAVTELEKESTRLNREFARQQAIAQNAVSKLDELEEISTSLARKQEELRAKRSSVQPTIAETIRSVNELKQRSAEVEQELGAFEKVIAKQNAKMSEAVLEETTAKVEFARTEQRLEAITTTLQQSTSSQEDRLSAVKEAQAELSRLEKSQSERELEILQLTTLLAEAYLQREAQEAKLDGLAESAAELRATCKSASRRLEAARRKIEKSQQQHNTAQLELERYRESVTTLLRRFEEDYEITLEQMQTSELIESGAEQSTLDREASALRQDIASVGEINMAALAELDELQHRYDTLNTQYEDLNAAKESLQRIIQKINQDSRRMFLETLEIIRQNFQKLYRKSFGGGNADIVLEDGEDVLECGIDIIATPPGKTALSNSLLSGGEKALTAVALLLAIFQYRPSPFCVLDEVDAPFDEANIGRFVSVLNEFLDWTKFIIVTHSKKTMTASTTLYGVTMQESGVSKQVAVRFEDVNDKGEIRKAA